MEESKEENIVQDDDKEVTTPELRDNIDVNTDEVTEEKPEIDLELEKNVCEDIEETQEESEEEESQATETEQSTQPMTSRSEDEDKRLEVGFKLSHFSYLKPTFHRMTPRAFLRMLKSGILAQ